MFATDSAMRFPTLEGHIQIDATEVTAVATNGEMNCIIYTGRNGPFAVQMNAQTVADEVKAKCDEIINGKPVPRIGLAGEGLPS